MDKKDHKALLKIMDSTSDQNADTGEIARHAGVVQMHTIRQKES